MNLEVIKNGDNLYKSRTAAIDFFLEYTIQKPDLDQNKKEQDLKY